MSESKIKNSSEQDKDRFKKSITPISDQDMSVQEMPDGRLSATQKVEHVNIGELDDLVMNPAINAPHEVAFRAGDEEHRIMSEYGRAGTRHDLMQDAANAAIKVIEKIPEQDKENFGWLHMVFKDGETVGMERIATSLLRNLDLYEGRPMAEGQRPVTDLHVVYYEGEHWARPQIAV